MGAPSRRWLESILVESFRPLQLREHVCNDRSVIFGRQYGRRTVRFLSYPGRIAGLLAGWVRQATPAAAMSGIVDAPYMPDEAPRRRRPAEAAPERCRRWRWRWGAYRKVYSMSSSIVLGQRATFRAAEPPPVRHRVLRMPEPGPAARNTMRTQARVEGKRIASRLTSLPRTGRHRQPRAWRPIWTSLDQRIVPRRSAFEAARLPTMQGCELNWTWPSSGDFSQFASQL